LSRQAAVVKGQFNTESHFRPSCPPNFASTSQSSSSFRRESSSGSLASRKKSWDADPSSIYRYSVIRIMCSLGNCHKSFESTAILDKHMREDHGCLPMLCPALDCKRSYYDR